MYTACSSSYGTTAKHEEILHSVTVKYQEEVANLRLTIEKQSVSPDSSGSCGDDKYKLDK